MDELLEKAEAELDPAKRAALLRRSAEDHGRGSSVFSPLVLARGRHRSRKDHPVLSKLRTEDLSATGALEPILLLR